MPDSTKAMFAKSTALVFLCIAISQLSVAPVVGGTFRANNSSEVRNIRHQIQAAQFLSKATFGPTQEMIDGLSVRIGQIGVKRACEEWIDEQFALPMTSQEGTCRDIIATDGRVPVQEGVGVHLYRYQGWWHVALTSEDQLRQRVAWSLSQIFAVGTAGAGFENNDALEILEGNGAFTIPQWLGLSNYYDMLAGNAFGNYRKLLGDVTYHPVMGVWLSSVNNQKALKQNGEVVRFPDENYAREIMQLFSVGLYELLPDGRFQRDAGGALIPTYDIDDISEMARVFTGLQYDDGDPTNGGSGRRNFGQPMFVNGNRHDNNLNYSEDPNAPASKTVFGVTLPPLPANYNSLPGIEKHDAARSDIDAALDVIANHNNVGPFISRILIQRLVKSNPSRAYLARVTSKWNDNGEGKRGDLKAVIKAILLDPEVFRGQQIRRIRLPSGELQVQVKTRGVEYSRLREPVVRIASFIRAMRPTSNYERGFMMMSHVIGTEVQQNPFQTPTVFNYYLPDYQSVDLVNYTPSRRLPNSSVYHPEFQILDAVTSITMADRLKVMCRARYADFPVRLGRCRISFDLDREISLAGDDSQGGNDYDNPLHNKGKMKDLLEQFDLLLCNGSMAEETKRIIYEGLATTPADGPGQRVARVENLLLAIVASPDCAVED